MAFPEFFSSVPTLKLHDGLSQLLGATDDGMVEYHYVDAVRLAGHSCPTVAGSWLTARAALRHLYPEGTPERGDISVFMDDAPDAGVTGVIGQVLTLVTGAAADNGFHGLGGRHVRSHLLHYSQGDIRGVRFQRNDNGKAVEIDVDASSVPPDPRMGTLIQMIFAGQADAAKTREFGQLWQDRVRRLLLEHADDPAVVRVRALN